jgi:hypothetical protein
MIGHGSQQRQWKAKMPWLAVEGAAGASITDQSGKAALNPPQVYAAKPPPGHIRFKPRL